MSFKLVLVSELEKRRARNRRYSLRSFARRLGVDHSTLSQILRGRRALTRSAVRRLALRLGLAPGDYELEAALLAMTRRAGFRPDSREIARKLGITVDAVSIGLQRLLRTGSLRMRGSSWLTP